ncbi:hypothetical protein ACWEVY_28765 [Streptomyces longwoodensis]
MKPNQMAVGMTQGASAVLEWSTHSAGLRLTLLESGERFMNEALEIGASEEWGIPSDRDLSTAVLELLTPSLISTRTADELWVSARFGLVTWFSAVALTGTARVAIETAMEKTVWA